MLLQHLHPSATTSKPPHEDVTDLFVQCLHMFLVDCNEDLHRDGLSLTFDELGRGVAFEDVRALIPAGTGIVETLEAAGAVSKSGPAMVRVRAQPGGGPWISGGLTPPGGRTRHRRCSGQPALELNLVRISQGVGPHARAARRVAWSLPYLRLYAPDGSR